MTERLDCFMARANAAYYATRDPFADFTTAPEISQVFGELLGLWTAIVWRMLGSPSPIVLAEAGPGRGHLMHDALRAADRAMPAFTAAASVHLIETSPLLADQLRERLPMAQIHADLADLPNGPLILLANEFLDALPIRQFVRHNGAWLERHVEDGSFIDLPTTATGLPDDPDGTIRERGEAAETFVTAVARRIADQGGAALLVDYGHASDHVGDTLQAITDGAPADPLAAPGRSDLTAHVDFGRLVQVACRAGAKARGPVAQGAFLAALGIHERTAQLGRQATPEEAFRLLAATRRLTAPEAMGSLFRALAIGPAGLDPFPGFSA